MIATCRACGREIEVRVGRLIKHAIYAHDHAVCHASHTDYFHAPEAVKHGVGAKGVAPCGHQGEHITTNMVLCGQGCDRPKKRCPHALSDERYDPERRLYVTSCRACGALMDVR